MKTILQITIFETHPDTYRLDFGRTGNQKKNIDVLYTGIMDGLKANNSGKLAYLELLELISSVVETIKLERPDLASQIRAQVIAYKKSQ
jgi:hypothetical protein